MSYRRYPYYEYDSRGQFADNRYYYQYYSDYYHYNSKRKYAPPTTHKKKEYSKTNPSAEINEVAKTKTPNDPNTKQHNHILNFKPEEISRLPFTEKYEIIMSWLSFQEGANKERMEIFNSSYGKAMKDINWKIIEQESMKAKKANDENKP